METQIFGFAASFPGPVQATGPIQGSTGALDVTARGVERGTLGQGGRLADAIAEAVALDRPLYFPGGATPYRIDGPIVISGLSPRVCGDGTRTIIEPDANDYDWLTIGGGTTTGNGPGTAWVRDLVVRGANTTLAPLGATAGLVLNAVRGVEVRNVQVDYAPIGFDLRNNCFGSSFYGCRTLFDRCRIGIDLRGTEIGGGFASGNDIPFFNCWFGARDAGVKMSRAGGFYRFYNGQIGNNGTPADPDNTGTLLVDTTLGNIVATFHGVSFEGANNTWNVRVSGASLGIAGSKLLFSGCSFFGKTPGTGALGVLKLTGPSDDVITFHDCGVHDTYNGPQLLSIEAVAGSERPSYTEWGTYGTPTVGGGQQNLRNISMMTRANLQRAFAMDTSRIFWNGGYLRMLSTGKLQQSVDGTIWEPAGTI